MTDTEKDPRDAALRAVIDALSGPAKDWRIAKMIAFRDQCRAAIDGPNDSKRLDWIEGQESDVMFVTLGWSVLAHVKGEPLDIEAPTLREAVDLAIEAEQA